VEIEGVTLGVHAGRSSSSKLGCRPATIRAYVSVRVHRFCHAMPVQRSARVGDKLVNDIVMELSGANSRVLKYRKPAQLLNEHVRRWDAARSTNHALNIR
jgi:hypothetical protein